MRSAVFVALLVTSSLLLAGCSKKKDEDTDHTFVCSNGTTLDLHQFADHDNATFNAASHCPGAKTSGSKTNTTTLAPNKLPILHLNITDNGGNKTSVTLVNGNLTFNATGSKDPDGLITGIAVTVQDANQTRTASLYDPIKKAFKPAHFKFDRPGVVNVTVAMVDDRAGFTVNKTHVYVDQLQVLQSHNIASSQGLGGPCDDGGQTLFGAFWYAPFDFTVVANVSFIDAAAAAGSLAICGPDGTVLSDGAGNPVTTTPDAKMPPPKGIESYYVGGRATTPHQDVAPIVLVHYEPRKA